MAVHIQGPYIVRFIYVAIVFYGAKCAAMDLGTMDSMLGSAVIKALQRADITILEAVAIMKIDESQFRKALRGEGYRNLALNHLVRLGPIFMAHLTGELMWLTAKQRALEIVETVHEMRKGA